MPGAPRRCRRRRCPFCHTLFRPHPRLGARQWTCGAPACQRERHAQSCRAWRRRNRAVTRTHYRDYVQPARTRAGPSPVSPHQVASFLRGVHPAMRDAIMAQAQPSCGLRAP
jgi:hypothetical protein